MIFIFVLMISSVVKDGSFGGFVIVKQLENILL